MHAFTKIVTNFGDYAAFFSVYLQIHGSMNTEKLKPRHLVFHSPVVCNSFFRSLFGIECLIQPSFFLLLMDVL